MGINNFRKYKLPEDGSAVANDVKLEEKCESGKGKFT